MKVSTSLQLLPDYFSGRAIEVHVYGAQDERQNKMQRTSIFKSPESIISQYGGIKGNNTTYGNTSIGAYYAIQRACKDLLNGHENAMVCASNSSGTYSQIMIG